MKVHKILLVLLLGITLPAQGQHKIKLSWPDAQRLYPVQHIRYYNGEADPTASRILEDSYGLIWIGTISSLISFDGYDYNTYKVSRSDSGGLAGYWIISLMEDRDRNIWAGTYGALNRLDRKTGSVRHFFPDTMDVKGPNNIIRFIAQDKQGLIWTITNRNIYRLDPGSGKFTEFRLDSLATLRYNPEYEWVGTTLKNFFLEDRQGSIWICTSNGLFYFEPVSGRYRMIRNVPGDQRSLSHNNITAVVQDATGNIWVSTLGGGLNHLLDKEDPAFEHFRYNPRDPFSIGTDTILSLSLARSGKLWVGGKGSFSVKMPGEYRFTTWELENYRSSKEPPRRMHVNEVFEDHEGGVWLFFRNYGIGRLFPVENLLVFQDLNNSFQHEICMDRSGSFWVGSLDDFAFRIDLQAPRIKFFRYYFIRPWIFKDRSGIFWTPQHQLTFNSLNDIIKQQPAQLPGGISYTAMHEDQQGNLWFVADRFYRFNPATGAIKTFRLSAVTEELAKSGQINYIHADKKGVLWYGNRTFLACFNTSTGSDSLFSPVSMKFLRDHNWQIEQILIDTADNVWIATLEGLCRIETDRDNRFTRYTHNPFQSGTLGDNGVFRVVQDKQGGIWALTIGSGLYCFDRETETFTAVDPFKDIPYLCYYDLIADKNGDFWFIHSAGISRFSPIHRSVRNFSYPKGSLSLTVSQVRDGTVFITPNGDQGTYVFHPDSLRYNNYIPPVYITRLQVNNRPIRNIFGIQNNGGLPFRLTYRENDLVFTFSALNYTDTYRNLYRYRMIGQDSDTSNAGTNHSAEYRNMRPGRYTFWVTGSNNDGLWNPTGTSVSFVIRHPWYTSAGAWIVYGLLFVLSVMGYIRLRIHQLSLVKVNLEKQVADRTSRIVEQKQQLEQKNQLIMELDQTKTRFFANISHEFRTPLTLIQGPVEEMLEQPRRSEKDRTFLQLIYKNTRRLLSLVNQLLDIARIDSSKMKLELAEADVIDFLRTIAASFSSMAETRRIRFTYQLPIVVRHMWFDRDKIEKIANNLLSNAFKFTPEGGKIMLKADYIESQHGLPEMLEFSVSDTGIGIPADLTEKIFDRFYQVEESLRREGSGAGLGLSLTRDLIRIMHGEITVNSEKGKGSIFNVKIPLGKDHLQPEEYVLIADQSDTDKKMVRPMTPVDVAEIRTDVEDQPFLVADKPVVLIVEDNKDIRQHILQHFDRNFNLVEAIDGRAGWKIATEVIPDLVITDLMMPHMDGTELCRQLKTDERTSHIPVIMLTARATLEDKLKGLETGADDYVSKPFNMKELLTRSVNLVEQRRKLRERFSREIILEPRDIVITSVDEKFLQRAISVVENHISEEQFSVTLLCEAMNMSRSTLFRKLYALTGQSPVDFVNTIRLKRAAGLLRQHAGNITVVALEVGFSNPSYFAKLFKRQFGIAPRQYAKT